MTKGIISKMTEPREFAKAHKSRRVNTLVIYNRDPNTTGLAGGVDIEAVAGAYQCQQRRIA